MARIANRTPTLIACAICPAVTMGVFLAFPIWSPAWMREFGLGRSAVMMAYSASGIVMTLALPLVGRLLTRIPVWRLVALGAVLLGGGLIFASRLTAYAAFAPAYVFAIGPGVALAGILPSQTLAIRIWPHRVGAISGLMMAAMALSGFVTPLLLTPLKATVGWRAALAILGLGVLIFLPLVAFGLMRQPHGAAANGAHGDGARIGASAGDILKTGGFWIILAAALPLAATPTAVQANVLPILADHGIGERAGGLMLSAMALSSAFGAATFGWLADRLDARLMIAAAAGVMAGALLLLAGSGGLPAAVTVAGLMALGFPAGGLQPLLSIFTFRRFGAAFAPAFGLLNLFLLPYMLAPPLIGYVRDQTGSYALAFLAAAPLLLLGVSGVWLLKAAARPSPRAAPAE